MLRFCVIRGLFQCLSLSYTPQVSLLARSVLFAKYSDSQIQPIKQDNHTIFGNFQIQCEFRQSRVHDF